MNEMIKISFENTEVAFKDKSDKALKRAYWLFKMVGSSSLVSLGSVLLRLAIWLRFPVNWALKPTVFRHFCGGETIDDCHDVITTLGASKVMTILDYSAEGKDHEDDFDMTRGQVMASVDKAVDNPFVPYAVFKPTGLMRFALLEKVQSGKPLSGKEQGEFDRGKKRFEDVCAYAVSRGVPIMIDSEESWIQEVVDRIVEELMFRFNKEKPMVFNTLQMYRHDRFDYLKSFINRGREQGIFSAFKLVRGAYMEKERERARKLGYASPIYPDKKATDEAFDQATAYCLANLAHTAVCVGTHNEDSCAEAVAYMSSQSVDPGHPHISFAQLLGMSDHISYNLAAAGYNVCKYVPYGPVKTVVPYLIRRAEENTSVAGQTSRELYLIKKEKARRKLQ